MLKMPVTLTKAARSDHTHWGCTNPLCAISIEMADKTCTRCMRERDVGAQAQDSKGTKIGDLLITDSEGEEYWMYDEVLTNGC